MRLLLILASVLLIFGCSKDDKDVGVQNKGLDANLKITISDIGGISRTGAKIESLPLPVSKDIACTASIPATCNKTLSCKAEDMNTASWARPDCAYLAENLERLFEPAPKDQICTDIYGGPEKATITGTINGRKINEKITRVNGCEISRYELHEPLWNDKGKKGPRLAECPDKKPVDPDNPVATDCLQ